MKTDVNTEVAVIHDQTVLQAVVGGGHLAVVELLCATGTKN